MKGLTRYKPGIGAVTRTERRGFSEKEQEIALAECKYAQYAVQEGQCIYCCRPMGIMEGRWISCHGAHSTLSEWAKAMTKEFHAETLCPVLHHRSPDEIRAEYGDAHRGHELACRGCAMRFHHCLYGENGAGAAYRRTYSRFAQQRGITDDQQQDPVVVMSLHAEVISYLGQTRAARLADARGQVTPADTEHRAPKARPGGRKPKSKRRLPRQERPGLYELGCAPDSDANLRAAQEEAWSRPETDLERMTREILEEARAGVRT